MDYFGNFRGGLSGGGGGGGGDDDMAGPSASIRRSAALSGSAATRTPIPMDTIIYASSGMVDLGAQPTRITITQQGLYDLEMSATYDPNLCNGSEFGWNLCVNGLPTPNGPGKFVAIFNPVQVGPGTFQTCFTQRLGIALQIGDYVQAELQSDGGWGLAIQEDSNYFQFSPMLTVLHRRSIP